MEHTTPAHVHGGHERLYQRNAVVADRASCWKWQGRHDRYGYAASHGRSILSPSRITKTGAHRVGYLLHRGPIPAGMVLDHLCRNRWCVNPWHLEVVTNHVNTLRQRLPQLCRSGLHALTSENARIDKAGHWRCRECARALNAERCRRWRARQRG